MTPTEWLALSPVERAEMVYGARFNAHLTHDAAAKLIGAERRSWLSWEAHGKGHRRMEWAKYELFLRLTE